MTKNANPFGDLTKVLEQFNVPGVDMRAFIEARRKDFEALVIANQAANETMQAVARKQSEMLAQSMQAIQAAASNAAPGVGGLVDPVQQAELTRPACDTAVEGLKDLAEMTRKSQADTLAMLSKHAAERMSALKGAVKPK